MSNVNDPDVALETGTQVEPDEPRFEPEPQDDASAA